MCFLADGRFFRGAMRVPDVGQRGSSMGLVGDWECASTWDREGPQTQFFALCSG